MNDVKFTDNSKEFIEEKNRAVIAALEAIGLTAEAYAKLDCPVDTGLLRNSITHAVSGERTAIDSYEASRPIKGEDEVRKGTYEGTIGKKNEATVFIGTNVEYAEEVEYNDRARHTTGKAHFLRDAATTHTQEYKNIVMEQLKS